MAIILVCYRDVRPAQFISSIDKGNKVAQFLLQKMPHIITHKDVSTSPSPLNCYSYWIIVRYGSREPGRLVTYFFTYGLVIDLVVLYSALKQ